MDHDAVAVRGEGRGHGGADTARGARDEDAA